MTGLDLLLELDPLPFKGARVGFLGHAASTSADGQHALNRLKDRTDWNLVRLFSPEHGFDGRAAAGEKVGHQEDSSWQLPVFSLYGSNRSPKADWLADLDLMVTDLMDLGVRCYTYASTLRNVMQVCAGEGVPMLVLDRPTPLAGVTDGPPLDPAFRSFVGAVDLPMVYGWSQGLLATWLQAHDPSCTGIELQVMMSDGPLQDWTPPSPALGTPDSARCYPITVWSEAISGVEVDRGGPLSFQIWAMQDLPAPQLADTLDGLAGVGVSATEFQTGSKLWPALQFRILTPSQYRPITFAVHLLDALCMFYGSKRLFAAEGCRPDFFDKLMGTSSVREALCAGKRATEIVSSWS